jgi:hypothetical protein
MIHTARPVYPFPVVIAIRNAHEAWPFGIEFEWSMRPRNRAYVTEPAFGYLVGVGSNFASKGTLNQTEPLFHIGGTKASFPLKFTEWILMLEFTLQGNCNSSSNISNPEITAFTHSSNISFSFNDQGKLPDILPSGGGPYAEPLMTLDMVGSSPSKSITYPNYLTLGKDNLHPPPNVSVLTIPATIITNITEKMLRLANCSDSHIWPDLNMTQNCNDRCYRAKERECMTTTPKGARSYELRSYTLS